jgi:hypothetical protein
MIQIKPRSSENLLCNCGGSLLFNELIWQGLHICEKLTCETCKEIQIHSLPVNQSGIEEYTYFPGSGKIFSAEGNVVKENWYSSKLRSVSKPVDDKIELKIEIIKKYDEVIILNTLDYIYGHSLLFLLNLQRLIRGRKELGIIVLVQPMLRWLIPVDDVAEIWTVNLGFSNFNYYYPDLSDRINSQLERFSKIWISKGHLIPTNENIEIERFTGIAPFDFIKIVAKPRITFVWREDTDRLWIRNIYLLKGFKKLKLGFLLKPFHFLRVLIFLRLLKNRLGNEFFYSVAGLGRSFWFPGYINDLRIDAFNEKSEKELCKVYSESVLVIGVHGSGMLLPSAHSGMTISLMPSKRWGNYAEDILFSENDIRLACFQKRILPLNTCIFDICDMAYDMITGRDYFIKKFMHGNEL